MVKGLDVFQEHFAAHSDQFILIGGTAATLAMEQAGLDFRATKDLDIVLHIEALTPAFGTTIARQSTWQVRVKQDGKGSRGIGIMPLMIVAGKRYVEG